MKTLSKIILSLLILISCSLQTIAQEIDSKQDTVKERPTVALVLSGGGAKGFAHIGILEALDELDIPVDYIVGTSMGSIMGGFYAIGYSGKDIAEQVAKQDWSTIFTDQITSRKTPVAIKDELNRYAFSFPIKQGIKLPKGIVRGQRVMNILSKYTIDYHATDNFSDLPIPFSCVAVDLESGEAVVLEKGYLPKAMRASMSIPSIFTPVKIDDRLFVDGGVINNFPADVAKVKEYDYIIGVDVQSPLRSKDELVSATDIVNQLVSFAGRPRTDKNIKLTDIYIHPDISGYTTGSFTKDEIDSIISRGRKAAKEAYPKLLNLKKKLGENAHRKELPQPVFDKKLTFKHITVEGLHKTSKKLFLKKLKLKDRDSISIEKLETTIDDISAILNFDLLNYRLSNDTLAFTVHERPTNRFNVGMHYDSDNNASVLLNTTWNNILFKNSRTSIDAILGKNLQFTGRYSIKLGSIPYLNFAFDTKKYELALYDKNNKIAEGDISYVKFDMNAQAIFWETYSVGIGIRKEYIDVANTLNMEDDISQKNTGWYTNHYAFIKLNTLDKAYYPMHGIRFSGELKYVSNGDGQIGTIAYANFTRPTTFSKNFTVLWKLYGRAIFDNQLGDIYQNHWGGINNTQHFDYQLPFVGTNWMQGYNSVMTVGRLDLRYQLFRQNYLILSGNYGRLCNNPDKFFTDSAQDIWGAGITYSYDSIIGPIALTIMHSTKVNRPLLNISIGYDF